MSESEAQSQALIEGQSHQTVVNVGVPAQESRSTRPYKIAGIVLVASVLLMSQAVITYFLLSQRNDIKSLRDQNNGLMSKGRSVVVPMEMHGDTPIHPMPSLVEDKDASPQPSPPNVSLTDCQLEAAGLKPVQVPGFHPQCDENGSYQAKQCYMGMCWCVNPVSGEQIPESLGTASIKCSTAVMTGGLRKISTVPDINV